MTYINDDELLYTPDELSFRRQTREFVEREIRPMKDQIELRSFDHRVFFKKLADGGFSGLLIPEKYGGSDKPFMYQLIAGEELSAVSPSTTICLGQAVHSALYQFLDSGQKNRSKNTSYH